MRLAVLLPALLVAGAAQARKPSPAQPPPLPQTMATVTDTEVAVATKDDARKIAEAYLNALTGQGSEAARDSLLGGATMTARIFTLDNWKVAAREKHRHEVGELADITAICDSLDKEGRAALAKIMGGGPGAEGDDLSVRVLSAEDAKQLLAPTRAKAAILTKTHPVFAYMARVDKEVYWHPKNPFRKLLADAGNKGPYTVDFDLFWIETEEGLGEKTVRRWPLRVVRFKTEKVDSGAKILPASDWNGE